MVLPTLPPALRGEVRAGLETFDRAIKCGSECKLGRPGRDLDNYTTRFILDALVALGCCKMTTIPGTV